MLSFELRHGRSRSRRRRSDLRCQSTLSLLEVDESYDVLAEYEQKHPRAAKRNLPRMLEGYDFSDEMRRELAETGTIVAFEPEA